MPKIGAFFWTLVIKSHVIGPNNLMKDYQPGTNGLDAFEACLECGACSEEKFLKSDEFNAFKTGQIVGSIIGGVIFLGCLIACCCYYCCQPKSEDVTTTGTVVAAPAPVQPVMQPTTTVVINNNNNSGFQQPQFQPQQQVKYQIKFSDCTWGRIGTGTVSQTPYCTL